LNVRSTKVCDGSFDGREELWNGAADGHIKALFVVSSDQEQPLGLQPVILILGELGLEH
jgi:hypothetical protein